MEEKNNNEVLEIDIMSLLAAMWRRLWLIVLAVVVCAVGAFCYARYSVTPLYEASTVVYVNNSGVSVGSAKISLTSTDLNTAARLIDTYVIILKTRSTLEKVIEKAEVDLTYEELYDMVEASAINDTEIFEVNVTDSSPKRAQLLANTITQVLPERIESIMDACSVRVVDAAIKPKKPVSPDVTRYTIIGALIGAVISCGIIVVMELFDNQIRSEDYLHQNYPKITVLAAIPDLNSEGRNNYRAKYYRSKDDTASAKRTGGSGANRNREVRK